MGRTRHFSEAANISRMIRDAQNEIKVIDIQIARTPLCDTERLAELYRDRQEKNEDIIQWHKQLFDFN